MMKRLSVFLSAIILLTILCSCGKNNNSLIGAWYNDEEGVVCIFSEDGDWAAYMLDVSYNSNPELDIYTSKYILTDNNHLTIEEQNNVSSCTYTYQISNNTLQLTIEDIDFHLSLTRAKNTTDASSMIVGNWRLLGAEYAGDTYYARNLYDITFFLMEHSMVYGITNGTSGKRLKVATPLSTMEPHSKWHFRLES